MKPIVVFGVVLIALGVVAFGYQGVTYTSRESIVDIGPVHATADREKTVAIPAVLAGVIVAAGVALVIGGRGKRA